MGAGALSIASQGRNSQTRAHSEHQYDPVVLGKGGRAWAPGPLGAAAVADGEGTGAPVQSAALTASTAAVQALSRSSIRVCSALVLSLCSSLPSDSCS